MSMKKILMAAAAVTALAAGVANAASIDLVNSTIGTKPVGITGTPSATSEPYTLANEVKLDATTAFGSSGSLTNTSNLKLKILPSSNSAIGVGDYLLSFNITNGSFDIASLGATNLTVTPVSGGTAAVQSTSTVSAGTVSFIIKVTVGNLQDATLNVGVKTGTTRAPISVAGTIVTLNGGVNVDGGTISSANLVDFRDGMLFNATAQNQTISLASGFKKFAVSGSSDVTEAIIGKTINFTPNSNATVTSDVPYKDTAGTALPASDIASAVLTIGGDLSAFNAKLGAGTGTTGSQSADVTTAPSVITADSTTNLPALKTAATGAIVTLAQKTTPVAGTESSYTVTPVITYTPTTLAPLTYAAKSIGSVSFEGTSFYAAWVGDGSNGITYSIRLGNRTANAVSSVKATLLNPITTGTSGTVASTASCEVGPIPASGELIVSSGTLQTCFGAFKRSDVRFVIQTASSSLTAKMRTVSNGMVTEAPLGTGTSDKNGAAN